MKNYLIKAIQRFLPIYRLKRLNQKIGDLQNEVTIWKKGFCQPGHYYSPLVNETSIPDITFIDYNAQIPGICLNEDFQFNLIEQLSTHYREKLFPDTKDEKYRYYFDNDYFGYSDGITLFTLMKHFKPKRIVEVGSGFSSALVLDVNDRFFNSEISIWFIEPYPEERLLNLIRDNEKCEIIKEFVQNSSDKIWESLEENDILFIDSSHVSKYNSDVNFLFFNVLPKLKKGVIIHIHDVFFPFEYPGEWLRQGRSWNEAYLLRAFLQYNDNFEIILFTSFLEGKYRLWFESNMPLCLKTHKVIQINGETSLIKTTGQSIYLRKCKRTGNQESKKN